MEIINFLDEIAVKHPFLANVVITGVFNGIFITLGKIIIDRTATNSQMKLNAFTSEIEIEFKTKYMFLENKTKNLLELYPRLIQLINEAAGALVVYFTTVINKVDEINSKEGKIEPIQIISLLENYLDFFSDEFSGAKELQSLNNELASSSIFISADMYKKMIDFKKDAAKLWNIVQREVTFREIRKYSKEQLLDLIERARFLIESLDKQKEEIAQTINQELSGESKTQQLKKWKNPFKNAA
jgi:hypothetical protein